MKSTSLKQLKSRADIKHNLNLPIELLKKTNTTQNYFVDLLKSVIKIEILTCLNCLHVLETVTYSAVNVDSHNGNYLLFLTKGLLSTLLTPGLLQDNNMSSLISG